jgi:1-deoxyxylulose-5-phosphate synthase
MLSDAGDAGSDGPPMRRLPGLPRDIPVLGVGCWPLGGAARNNGVAIGWADVDDATADAALRAAYEAGVRLFDTADVYGFGRSERRLGRLLASIPRDEVVVTSKVGYFAPAGTHPYEPHQIRRQFQASLRNLDTDYLDAYVLHSGDFGPGDEALDGAIRTVRQLQADGLVRAVGMRAPHEFAAEWAGDRRHPMSEKAERFLHLFDRIRPEIVSVRRNYLGPHRRPGETDVLAFAGQRNVGVVLKQVVGQGLLLRGPDSAAGGTAYDQGDHRTRKCWFTAEADSVLRSELAPLYAHFGAAPEHLMRVALGYALQTAPNAVALLGVRTAAQIRTAVRAMALPPLTPAELHLVAEIGWRARKRLEDTVGPAGD